MVLALRQPYTFTWCVTMSGAFDITQFLDGYFDEDCYFLNPPGFLPDLSDGYYLDQFRRNKWVLATGEWDICRAATESFSGLLHHKGVPHSLHVWGDGSKHDWPHWRPMAAAYLP
jgi:esterase/lipase superfamily enzyme